MANIVWTKPGKEAGCVMNQISWPTVVQALEEGGCVRAREEITAIEVTERGITYYIQSRQ